MIANAGAGPRPIPHAQFTSQRLAEAIKFCLSDDTITAAGLLRNKILQEHGAQDAVDSFHRHLPVQDMRCDILPDQPAAWNYTRDGKTYRVSKVAAAVLVQHAVVRRKDLKRYGSKSIEIKNIRWDPVTGITSSLISTSRGMVTSGANIFVKPVQAFSEVSPGQQNGAIRCPADSCESLQTSQSVQVSDADGPADSASKTSAMNTLGRAVVGSASGVGGVLHHFAKGMLVDMPLAVTEGMHAVPRLYGSEVRDHGPVKDWKSGFIVAGKNISHGFVDGAKDLVDEPLKGAREGGVVGGVVGVGKGVANMITKTSSGMNLSSASL